MAARRRPEGHRRLTAPRSALTSQNLFSKRPRIPIAPHRLPATPSRPHLLPSSPPTSLSSHAQVPTTPPNPQARLVPGGGGVEAVAQGHNVGVAHLEERVREGRGGGRWAWAWLAPGRITHWSSVPGQPSLGSPGAGTDQIGARPPPPPPHPPPGLVFADWSGDQRCRIKFNEPPPASFES